jgi:hypothetical protein
MATGIEHEAAPREARSVLNLHGRNDVTGVGRLHELEESFQAVEHAEVGFGAEADEVLVDVERVGFIFAELRNFVGLWIGHLNRESGRFAGRNRLRGKGNTSARLETANEALGRLAEVLARGSLERIRKGWIDG